MNSSWPLALVAGILGLAVGSFLNVVIYRVPRDESVVSPPSHCPYCDVRIKGRHNVPVLGWLSLGGRCASCRVPISARYPLVEAATGLLFAGIVLRFGVTAQVPAFLYLAAIAVALAMIDFDVRRLPDTIVLPSYIVSIALLVPAGAVDANWHPAVRAVTGGIVLGMLVFTVALAFPHTVGLAYAKLAGLLGLYLGWISWSALAVGGATALVLALAALGSSRTRTVPLGPILITGTVLTVFGTFAG